MNALVGKQSLAKEAVKLSFFEGAKMRRQIFLYIVPVGVLAIAAIVMSVAFSNLPESIRQIPAWLLILTGLVISVSGLIASISTTSPRTLTGHIGRREFYGIIAVLIGWMLYQATHFDSWIIHLNSRIDQILARLP